MKDEAHLAKVTLGTIGLLLALLAPVAGWPQTAKEGPWPAIPPQCGFLGDGYGPHDYTDPVDRGKPLEVVERVHFPRDVEMLRRGANNVGPGGDLDYVLRAFPNHHRALYSMLRFVRMHPTAVVPPGARYPAECYFDRAVIFAPDDGVAHMLRGMFLFDRQRTDDAVEAFETAIRLAPESAEIHYNYALKMIDLRRWDDALEHAHQAYALGHPLPGLRDRLKRAGRWREPPPQDAEQDDRDTR